MSASAEARAPVASGPEPGVEGAGSAGGVVDLLHPSARGIPESTATATTAESMATATTAASTATAGAPAAGSTPAPAPTARRSRLSAPSTATLYLLTGLALVLSLVATVRIGTTNVSYADVVRTAGFHLGLDVEPLPRLVDSLIWELRVPRVVMAALVGASLAVCGAALQAITRNALADPYLLGISSGASTGAVAVVVLGVGSASLGVTGGAFVGAMFSFGLLMLLLRKGGLDSVRVVLTGVVVSQLFTALTSLVLMASGDSEAIRAITQWLLGSMAPARWDTTAVTAVVTAVGLLVLWLNSASLDGFSFGTDTASSLGVDVRTTRWVLLVVTSLMTAVAVASVGAIGFVGLIVPHGVRFLVGPPHRTLLPLSALVGAVFLVWTDALARVAFAPQEVPVGVFTALLGVPLFLLVLRKRGEL